MLRLFLFTSFLSAACGGPEPEESAEVVHVPASEGGEVDVEPTENRAESNTEPGGVIGVLGGGPGPSGDFDSDGRTPEQEALIEAERQAAAAERQAARAAEEAEYQARCSAITLTPGLPPQPPTAPRTPGLEAIRPTYEASLARPFARPANNSTSAVNEWARTVFTQWLRESMDGIRALERTAGTTPPQDHQHARVWLAHAHAVFIERFGQTPVPDEIAQDPELRAAYLIAVTDQRTPLLARVAELVDGITLPGPWQAWESAMEAWLTQEECSLH